MFLSPKIWGCKYTNNFLFINKKAVFQHFGVLITSAASDLFLFLLLFSFSFLFPLSLYSYTFSSLPLPPSSFIPLSSYSFLHTLSFIPLSPSSFILLYSVTPSVPVVAHPPAPPYTTHPRTDIIRIISIRPTPY